MKVAVSAIAMTVGAFACPAFAQTAPSIAFADAIGKTLSVAQMRNLAAAVIMDEPSRRRAQGQFIAAYMLCPEVQHTAWPKTGAHTFACNFVHDDGFTKWGRQPRVMFYTKNNRIVTISVVRPFRRYLRDMDPVYLKLCNNMDGSPGSIVRAMTEQSGWRLVSSTPDTRWTRGQNQYRWNLLERGTVLADVFTYMWPYYVPLHWCPDYLAMSRTVFWSKSFRPIGMKNNWLLRVEE